MKQYSIFQAIYMSFFSKSLYQDVRKNWQGNAFLYLLLLTAIFIIPMMVKMHLGLADFMTNDAPKFTQQIPDITIKNGQVSTPEAKKYVITDPDNGEPFAIIDTTGETKNIEEGTFALLTKDKLIMQKNDTETRIYDLSEVKDFTINQNNINSWSNLLKTWTSLALYPFILFGIFIARIIQSLLYAVGGIIITKIVKTSVDYQSLIRLSAIAMTPVIIINVLIDLIGIKIPYLSFISMIATLGYLTFGILATKDDKGNIAAQPTTPTDSTPPSA